MNEESNEYNESKELLEMWSISQANVLLRATCAGTFEGQISNKEEDELLSTILKGEAKLNKLRSDLIDWFNYKNIHKDDIKTINDVVEDNFHCVPDENFGRNMTRVYRDKDAYESGFSGYLEVDHDNKMIYINMSHGEPSAPKYILQLSRMMEFACSLLEEK